MSDRTLIPAPRLSPGEAVQLPSGRLAVVRSVSTSGEVTVALAPDGDLAALRQKHIRRPYAQPAKIVFLSPIQEPASGEHPGGKGEPSEQALDSDHVGT